MKIAISGTYSTGKTTTTLALAYYTGLTRTHAKTMREILPKALPGKKLEDATGPELVQLGFRRLLERAVRESHLSSYVSDGSSLHEWVYGMVRTELGMNPNHETDQGKIILTDDLKYLREVMINFGAVAKDYAKETYDSFIHLPIEFPLVEDGHRPVSELFRSRSNDLLIETLKELDIPYFLVGGTINERLEKIVDIYSLKPVMTADEAINLAKKELKNYNLKQEGE
ncbi:AAA family ATPase [Streptococcus sobrinus]|uniref:AAA family ATPase n=1 Tax=Streptococcus sobrinus TaxID=1310 RepID=UPI0002FFCE5B|nr:AAA family ATPase [Streptococcus sobrinus]OZV23004.1 ATP/GTP-binding protein [Streptococcus sobrinus]